MPDFIVMVEGQNCLLQEPTRSRWFGRLLQNKAMAKPVGFFATRLVTAENSESAGALAVSMIRDELESEWHLLNAKENPPTFEVSETREPTTSDDRGRMAAGFTFYRTEARH